MQRVMFWERARLATILRIVDVMDAANDELATDPITAAALRCVPLAGSTLPLSESDGRLLEET